MAGKITYRKRNIVNTRQLYRRIAVDKNTWNEIQQNRLKINKLIIKKRCKYGIDNSDKANVGNIDNENAIPNISTENFNFINEPINMNDCIDQNIDIETEALFNNTVCKFLIKATPYLFKDSVEENLLFQLRHWAVQCKISQAALNDLLKILIPFHSKLPLDSRTLLKTNLSMPNRKLGRKEFYYIGLLEPLKQFVCRNISQLQNNEIYVSFNIDGFPLFKSSNTQL